MGGVGARCGVGRVSSASAGSRLTACACWVRAESVHSVVHIMWKDHAFVHIATDAHCTEDYALVVHSDYERVVTVIRSCGGVSPALVGGCCVWCACGVVVTRGGWGVTDVTSVYLDRLSGWVDDGSTARCGGGFLAERLSEMSAKNETTGAEYRGKNVDRLLMAEAEHGYGDEHGWAGFHQWLGAGRVVRKGEHGTACMTVVTVTDDKGSARKPRGFRVFHYDQTQELTEGSSEPIVQGWSTPLDHTGRARVEATVTAPAATVDNSDETVAARREMMVRLGWGVQS